MNERSRWDQPLAQGDCKIRSGLLATVCSALRHRTELISAVTKQKPLNSQWEELHTSFRLTQPFKQEQCKLINAISLIATLYSSPSVWISVSPDHVTANTLLLCFYQIPNISFIECVWSVLESDWPVRCIFASSPVHFQHLFTWGIKYWVHKHIVLDTHLVWLAMHTSLLTSFHKDR